jgi:hypothetical protein
VEAQRRPRSAARHLRHVLTDEGGASTSRPMGAWTLRTARGINPLPFDARRDAELVLLGVRHPDPGGSPEALRAFVDAMSAELLQPIDFSFDVVNHNVDVHAVFAGLGLWYDLKEKW